MKRTDDHDLDSNPGFYKGDRIRDNMAADDGGGTGVVVATFPSEQGELIVYADEDGNHFSQFADDVDLIGEVMS